ncbi:MULTISPECIES: alpha/beta hydrolase family protein [unclassified Myroides]|uniref:alpha/beta hydrolase family protein n=1 Tax=unclassified Myroides TaxID=2642485 RepID=UPI003D2F92C5
MNTRICFIYHLILFLLGTLSLKAQISTDSLKYSELRNEVLSNSGKLAVVRKYCKFDSNRDSIFIYNHGKQILGKQTNFLYEKFKDNSLTSYNRNKKELEIFDGSTLKTHIISTIDKPVIIQEYGLIFYLDLSTDAYKLIKVNQTKIEEIWSCSKDLIAFTSISDNQKILLIQYSNFEKGIELINLSNLKKSRNREITHPIRHAIWSKKHPVVFLFPTTMSDNKFPYLTFFNYNNNKGEKQILGDDTHFNDLEAISGSSFKMTQLYSIGQLPYDAQELEIWSTNDRYLGNVLANSKANINELKTNGFVIFDYYNKKVSHPEKLNDHDAVPINEKTLLVFDSNQYLDYTHQWSSRPRDISLYDLQNDTLTIITKQQVSPFNTTSLSPRGTYFVYIKKDEMYFYNTKNKIIENSYNLKSRNNVLEVSKLRTWSKDERFFYFESNSNLIQYDTKNKKFKIVLDGSDKDTNYRILNSTVEGLFNTNSELHHQTISNNSDILLVQKLNNNDQIQSLILIDKNKQTTIIDNTQDRISDVKYSSDFNTITYCLENFNKPKTVYIYQNRKTNLLTKNTMPQSLYNWKKQKIVSYMDQYGNNLKGVLFYPKNYHPNQKYPMITRIYSIQLHRKTEFNYPTNLNDDGFNTTLFQENNYFVFFPDIIDIEQGTGLSALHCVEESIKTVLEKEKSIDKEKLGLFGFSHGGYETNFIITQTNLFKAAVSGSGNVDLVKSYFSYNEDFVSPFFFQFENGQYRMPKTFKQDKEVFLSNSPILYADKITTPLLTYTGKKDENIHWEQQKEFFIAMLRYNVPHIALFYKNEGHGLLKKENQTDLTKRIMNWFDYYLKNKNTKETRWIKYYTTFEEERLIIN